MEYKQVRDNFLTKLHDLYLSAYSCYPSTKTRKRGTDLNGLSEKLTFAPELILHGVMGEVFHMYYKTQEKMDERKHLRRQRKKHCEHLLHRLGLCIMRCWHFNWLLKMGCPTKQSIASLIKCIHVSGNGSF